MIAWPESNAAGTLGDGRAASACDRPGDAEALRQAVVRRVAEGLAIYPQGGRTALAFGGVPRRPGAIVDTTALSRVIDYPFADMTITVEAGMTLAALQAVLAEHHQRLPLDAPDAGQATLGGIYATSTSGPRRLGAGRPRDLIIGVSFVTGQGALVKGGGRVVKNVAGYDFPKLLTGSMGTLGILTQLTLKVRPRPEASALAWAPLESAEQAASVLERLNTSGTRPIALELLNRSGARQVGEPLGLPVRDWVVVVGLEDNAASVAWQVDRLGKELPESRLEVRTGPDADPLWSGLVEFQARALGPVGIRANVRLSSVVSFARQLDPGRWAVQAHAGSGIVHGHLLGETDVDSLASELDTLRASAVTERGNLILPRCPTEWKARLPVWGAPRPDWLLGERIKQALDPDAVLNPGRFVATI